MEIEKLTKEDIDAYRDLFVYCFNMKEKDAQQYASSCLKCGETIGIKEEGKLVSAMAYYPYEANIHSSRLNMAGVTGVVTLPETRNKGQVREQMKVLQQTMRNNNFPISYLEPFKCSFYEKYGWTAASQAIRGGIKIDDIKECDEKFDFIKVEEPEVEDFFEIEQQYSSLYHGCSYRNRCIWEECVLYDYQGRKKTYYLIIHNGEEVAYVALRFSRIENEFQVNLNVADFGFKNYKGMQGLFKFFKTHRDQCRYVHINLPVSFDIYHFAPTRQKKLKLNFDKMFKVVDVENAMLRLKPSQNLDFDLTIKISRDTLCADNVGEFSFSINNGKVQKIDSSRNLLECDINTFSRLFIGKNSLNNLINYNELRLEGNIKDNLNALFPKKPIYVKDWF